MKRDITVRMDKLETEIEDRFTNLYCKKDFEYQYRVALSSPSDRQVFVLRKIAQMLNDIGVECEYGQTAAYYRKLIDSLTIPASPRELQSKLIETLCNKYSFYPKPEEFMQRIVDSLDPETVLDGSLELRILRQFVKTVNVRGNDKLYSKSLATVAVEDIDESKFDMLTSDDKVKPECYMLVQACYNLAKGKFISPTTTKKLLFIFAFAYDMRYYFSSSSAGYDVTRDVEKNLFVDYYCDNIARYLFSEDGGKTGGSDKEPSGLGLSPKNFIDTIFVYYLNNEELSPTQKINGFYSMVNRVKDAWKKSHSYSDEVRNIYEGTPTAVYRDRFAKTQSGMGEAEFEKFILDNYYCDVRYTYTNSKTREIHEGSKGIFEVQMASNTAFNQYAEILDLTKEVLGLSPLADFSKIDRRKNKDSTADDVFDKLFSDEDSILVARFSELEENVPSLDLECFKSFEGSSTDFEKFALVMRSIEERLNPYDALAVTDAINVTRTKLIAAYYHYYCLVNENGIDADQGDVWTSFKDVYEDMGGCLNSYLEEAGYQKISSKNLFDIFVIFLAYCKINNYLN